MASEPRRPEPTAAPILVPELRDYHQINAELVRRLDLGQRHVRLEGVAGHRLLVAGLAGPWNALVEIDGNAGPELASDLDAAGLTVVCRGNAADGAGSHLLAGKLIILGTAGTALGYLQCGGLILASAGVGPRAGLHQRGGDLVLLGTSGALAGERRSGGQLFLRASLVGGHLGFGALGGRCIDIDGFLDGHDGILPGGDSIILRALELSRQFTR